MDGLHKYLTISVFLFANRGNTCLRVRLHIYIYLYIICNIYFHDYKLCMNYVHDFIHIEAEMKKYKLHTYFQKNMYLICK